MCLWLACVLFGVTNLTHSILNLTYRKDIDIEDMELLKGERVQILFSTDPSRAFVRSSQCKVNPAGSPKSLPPSVEGVCVSTVAL